MSTFRATLRLLLGLSGAMSLIALCGCEPPSWLPSGVTQAENEQTSAGEQPNGAVPPPGRDSALGDKEATRPSVTVDQHRPTPDDGAFGQATPGASPAYEEARSYDAPPVSPDTPFDYPTPLPMDQSRPATTSDAQTEVRLSTGVALAQTLVDGTQMGFSVTYQFSGAEPKPSSKYVWVIQRGDGARVEIPAQIMATSESGTLQTFVGPWRPEHGPFKCHIEEIAPRGSRRLISRPVDLR